MIAALGAAITMWGLLRKLHANDKLVYTRTMKDGEMIRIRMLRGETVVEQDDPI